MSVARVLRGRAEPVEIYALAGDEHVMDTPSFRELRSRHLQLRSALLAGDGEKVLHLLDQLKESAPAGLKSLYEGFALRAADKAG